jgi:hypothetical protein
MHLLGKTKSATFLALPARGIIGPHDVISTKISRIAEGITELIRSFKW